MTTVTLAHNKGLILGGKVQLKATHYINYNYAHFNTLHIDGHPAYSQ